MKIKKYKNGLGIALVIAILFLGPSDSFGQFQMANTLVPLTGNDYPIIYANDAKGGHHQVARLSARDSITSQRRQVGMLCTVYDGVTAPVTYQLVCADTKAERDKNTNWVVFTPGGAASSVAWGTITSNPFAITAPVQGQLLSYNGTNWLNVNQSTIPLSGFGAATADVLLGGFKISNLADPASAQDAATRNYVDAASLTTSTAVTALNADTATIQPRLNNIIASIPNITGKVNISDTAAMLANYQSAILANNTQTAALITDSATIQPRLDNIISSMSATKLNISDTAAMLQYYAKAKALSDSVQILRNLLNAKLAKVNAGYGLSNINDSTLSADSATLAQYFIRRTDSTVSYVTPKRLSDSVTAIRSGLSGLKSGVDTIYNSSDTIFWSKSNQTYYSVIDTFTTNITAILSGSNTFGKYKNASVIPSKGKSARQVITDALTEAIVSYTSPSATITASPTSGTYEYGSVIPTGTINLSSTFTQNDAGAPGTPVYYANGVALGGTSFSIATLTSTQTFYVSIPYLQGNCKNNNLGVLDCTGRINASNATSGNISLTMGYRRYFGWLTDTTGITTGAQNAAILALVDNSGYSTSQAFGTSSSPINTPNPTGTQYWVMGYVSSTPITSITQNGFPSIAAYNTAVLNGFINTQGAAVALRIFYSKVGQTSSSTLYTN